MLPYQVLGSFGLGRVEHKIPQMCPDKPDTATLQVILASNRLFRTLISEISNREFAGLDLESDDMICCRIRSQSRGMFSAVEGSYFYQKLG